MPFQSGWSWSGATWLVLLVLGQVSGAAEVRFRAHCACPGSLIRLGDVADIHAASIEETERLEATELFCAPPPGSTRFIRAREILDALLLRGVNVAQLRLSGASQVEVSAEGGTAIAARPAPALSTSIQQQVVRSMTQAVVAHLQQQSSSDEPWQVDLQLSESQVQQILDAGKRVAVSGGAEPWLGPQQFVLTLNSPDGPAQISLAAQVSLPPAVVVATRSLRPGAIIQAADVTLLRDQPATRGRQPFYRLEDVVGRETTAAVAVGMTLDHSALRRPTLVRRGDAVTVLARSSGLQVRTTARSRDDGSQGDLITVESLLNRESFFARVTGIHEVEVYARPIDAGTTLPQRQIAPVEPIMPSATAAEPPTAERKQP